MESKLAIAFLLSSLISFRGINALSSRLTMKFPIL